MLYPLTLLHDAYLIYFGENQLSLSLIGFHPYPQVIGGVFNLHPFGPPLALTPASTCPWIDHLVSGLQQLTYRTFALAFATVRGITHLTLLVITTRRLIMQKAVRHRSI